MNDDVLQLLQRGAGAMIVGFCLRALVHAMHVPASKFTPGTWVAILFAGAFLYFGASAVIG